MEQSQHEQGSESERLERKGAQIRTEWPTYAHAEDPNIGMPRRGTSLSLYGIDIMFHSFDASTRNVSFTPRLRRAQRSSPSVMVVTRGPIRSRSYCPLGAEMSSS